MMSASIPLPKLKPDGAANLDSLLHSTVAKGNLPAIFYAATNVEGTIYENQDGDVVHGHEDSGKVNPETSKWARNNAR